MPSRRAATILTIGSLLLPQHAQAQCPDGTPPPCARATPAPAPASIAVLTFRSQSRDTSDVFLAEGLSDDIADRLSRGERVVVISREATRRLRDADALSMAELGRRLNAAYVVSGHLRRSGGQLHILIEVTRARTSQVAWSGPFDRSGDDLASMQVEAAAAIAGAVLGRPVSAPRAAAEPGANGPAFAHLMRGTAFSSRRLQGAAIAELRAAVRLDPRSAVAWARLSQAYSSCRSNGCTAVPFDSLDGLARSASDRALGLDSLNADAWLADGWARVQMPEFDLPAARRSLERSVRLDPQNAETHHVLAYQLARLGELDSAEHEYRRALALDAGRWVTWAHLADLALARGRGPEALALADTTAALTDDPLSKSYLWTAVALVDPRRLPGLGARLGIRDSTLPGYEAALSALAAGDTASCVSAAARLPMKGRHSGLTAGILARSGHRDDAAGVVAGWTTGQSSWFDAQGLRGEGLRGIPAFDDFVERARTRAHRTGYR